jgi:hypothetical protein
MHNRRIVGAVIATGSGCRPWLIHRMHASRGHGKDQPKGLSHGASFWFDALSKLGLLRQCGRSPQPPRTHKCRLLATLQRLGRKRD